MKKIEMPAQKHENTRGLAQYTEHLERIIGDLLSMSDDIITMLKNGVDPDNYENDYRKIKEFEVVIRDSKDIIGNDG